MFHRTATVLPQYSSGPTEVSRQRRIAMFAAKILVAAGYGAMVVLLPPSALYMLGLPIAAMLLLTLWMLPDRATYPRAVIEAIFPVFFIVNILWPVYIAIALPGLPWLTPTRMLLFVLTFLILYSVSTSSILRHHLLTVARSSKAMWLAFVAWEVMQIVTLPISHQVGESLKDFFDNQFRLTGLFFLGCLLFTRPGWATRIATLLVILATLASLDGFLELKLGYPPWAYHIPSFMRVDEALMANVLGAQSRSADGLYRVHGMAPNSLIFAQFLALCMPFIVHWMFTARSVGLRLLMIVVFAVVLTCIVLTQARLGLVGTIVTLICYPAIWALRRWRTDKTGIVAPAIVLGYPAIAAMMLVVILSSNTLSHRVFGGGAQAASDAARRTQREMAIPKILHNPIGYGLAQNGTVLGFVSVSGMLTVDSGYISTALDLGVVGFVSFYGLFLVGAWNGTRIYLVATDPEMELGGPLAVMMVVFVVLRSVVSQENNHPLVFILLGMLLALKARHDGLVAADGTIVDAPRTALYAIGHETPSPAAALASVSRVAG